MTDKHIIDKENGEVRKVEDARSFMLPDNVEGYYAIDNAKRMANPVDADDRPFDLNDVLAPVIETPRVVRSKFGAWRLDWEGTTVTVEYEDSVSEFEATIEDLADLARLLPAFLAKVVE